MEPLLSYCGMRCDLCLAYAPNVTANPENRQILSDGWQQYFGFRIPPEAISCAGCRSSSDQTLDKDCQVRPCASQRGLDHCAACEDYICEHLRERLVDFDQMQTARGQPIPQSDRQRFIYPYENRQRLEALRRK